MIIIDRMRREDFLFRVGETLNCHLIGTILTTGCLQVVTNDVSVIVQEISRSEFRVLRNSKIRQL